jgi:large subunit ribosomal protein L19
MTKLEQFNKTQVKNIPEIRPGYTLRLGLKIKEGGKEKIQYFEGLVIAIKHGKGINATVTVRKTSQGIGVERIIPLHSPIVKSIEIVKKSKVRRAKLYYIRKKSKKESRLQEKRSTKEEIYYQEKEEPKTETSENIEPKEKEKTETLEKENNTEVEK